MDKEIQSIKAEIKEFESFKRLHMFSSDPKDEDIVIGYEDIIRKLKKELAGLK